MTFYHSPNINLVPDWSLFNDKCSLQSKQALHSYIDKLLNFTRSTRQEKIGKFHVFTDLSSILLSYNSIFIIKPVIRTAIFAVAH